MESGGGGDVVVFVVVVVAVVFLLVVGGGAGFVLRWFCVVLFCFVLPKEHEMKSLKKYNKNKD